MPRTGGFPWALVIGVLVVSALLMAIWLVAIEVVSIGGPSRPIFQLESGDITLAALILLAIILTIYVPWRLTREPAPDKQPREPVEQLLSNPHVRRTILRFEIGGILAGVIAIVFAVWGLFQANQQSKLAEQALLNQRISSAWQILAQEGRGNIGKRYALETLATATDEPLSGLEFTCPEDRITPNWNRPRQAYDEFGFARILMPASAPDFQSCLQPVDFRDLSLGDPSGPSKIIRNSKFDFINASNMTVRNAMFSDTTFEGAKFHHTVFEDTTFWGVSFARSTLSYTDFEYAALVGVSFRETWLQDFVNINRSSIYYADFSRIRAGNLSISNSALHSADFTGLRFDLEVIRIADDVVFGAWQPDMDDINVADGAYGGSGPTFDISGVTFCDPDAVTVEIGCWASASQSFFDHAFYFEDNPPLGLDLLPIRVRVRPGCGQREGESEYFINDATNQMARKFDHFRDNCEPLPLQPVTELVRSGLLPKSRTPAGNW